MKSIHTTFFFESDSNLGRMYQTLLYADNSLSCDCKGWTRRVAPDGSRSCKHTRLVSAGLGMTQAVRFVCDERVSTQLNARPKVTITAASAAAARTARRQFTFEETEV